MVRKRKTLAKSTSAEKRRRNARKRKTLAKSTSAADEAKNSGGCRGTSLPSQTSVEGTITENNVQPKSNGLLEKRKASMAMSEPLRRSGRRRNLAETQGIEHTVHFIDLNEIDKEVESPHPENVNSPLQVPKEKSSEVETRPEQVGRTQGANEGSLNEMIAKQVLENPDTDVRYKSLYFNSQKKLEALMEENYELVRKLSFTEGQVAAYEKMVELMGRHKEVVLVSSLEKSTNVSLPALNCLPSACDDPKKKKTYIVKRKR